MYRRNTTTDEQLRAPDLHIGDAPQITLIEIDAAEESAPAAVSADCRDQSPGTGGVEEVQALAYFERINALFMGNTKQVDPKEQRRLMKAYALQEVKNHKVPLVIFFGLLIFPKLILLWLPTAVIWSVVEAVHRRLPLPTQKRLTALLPPKFRDSPLRHELSEGISQVRPFIMTALYLFCVPFALLLMSAHWLMKVTGLKLDKQPKNVPGDETMSFVFNRPKSDEEEEANFFHSPAFNIVTVLMVACGIPAAFTFFIYQFFGVDATLGYPSLDPAFSSGYLMGRLYLTGIGCCLAVLLIRSWFTFPLHFLTNEHRIELNATRIQRHMHGWFTQALLWNCPWAGTDSIEWSAVKAVHYENGAKPLYPLPKESFPGNSFFYTIMNKLAAFVDGVTKQTDRPELIHFSTCAEKMGQASKITLNISEMDGDQRARLFYAVRNWAPHVVVAEEAQQLMLGSNVLQAPQYTQLWFDLLTDAMLVKQAGLLAPGDTLKDGTVTIKERLASGGQANVYNANMADGSEVILKEFILSTSDAVGALLESAGEFETETTLLSTLTHERVVRMIDFFAANRRLYIILEKVPGSTLRQLVKGAHGPLSEQQTVEIALQVCDVLSYLHGQEPPVVHRDIAPDNIMFNETDGVKVIDFSLAAAKKARRTTSTMGKHSYAPPEQFREQPCPQSDIYALGATMYFLLTGEDPKPITVCDISAKCPQVSDKLAAIIRQATAFDLADRYADAKWLKLDLESLI